MRPKIDFSKFPIKESCIEGNCEGKCRELYYDICPAHQKYYLDCSQKKPKRIYIYESESNNKNAKSYKM